MVLELARILRICERLFLLRAVFFLTLFSIIGGGIYLLYPVYKLHSSQGKIKSKCVKGDVDSCYDMMNDLSGFIDWRSAAKPLKRRCESGDMDFCQGLGNFYVTGVFIPHALSQFISNYFFNLPFSFRMILAKKFFRLSCKEGYYESCYNLLPVWTDGQDSSLELLPAISRLRRQDGQNWLKQINYFSLRSSSEVRNAKRKACPSKVYPPLHTKPTIRKLARLIGCSYKSNEEKWNELKDRLAFLRESKTGYYTEFSNTKKRGKQGLPAPIEKVIFDLYKTYLMELQRSPVKDKAKYVIRILNLANFVLDTYFVAKRRSDLERFKTSTDYSFLHPIGFAAMFPHFFSTQLRKKDLNERTYTTLVPLPLLLQYLTLGKKVNQNSLKFLRNDYLKASALEPHLFFPALSTFSFFGGTEREMASFLDKINRDVEDSLCQKDGLSALPTPDSCSPLICKKVRKFELSYSVLSGYPFSNINCLNAVFESPKVKEDLGYHLGSALCMNYYLQRKRASKGILSRLQGTCGEEMASLTPWLDLFLVDKIVSKSKKKKKSLSKKDSSILSGFTSMVKDVKGQKTIRAIEELDTSQYDELDDEY